MHCYTFPRRNIVCWLKRVIIIMSCDFERYWRLASCLQLSLDVIHDSHEITSLEFPTSDCHENEACCHAKRTIVTAPIENTWQRSTQHCKFNAFVARIYNHSKAPKYCAKLVGDTQWKVWMMSGQILNIFYQGATCCCLGTFIDWSMSEINKDNAVFICNLHVL